ncbi:MAG TPA: tetratricopeptide repeat protein [Verrucomicrobiae bacterium]|nr:tetratricopeptide repeat protein [Verrucomicrobiae bacterium]
MMRLLMALFLICCGTLHARSAELPEFDLANRLYAQGKFTEAASNYLQLIQAGKLSPAIYFNLGNAYYKSGEAGRAIAAYRHAERLGPRDPDLRANLEFVRRQVQGPSHQPARLDRAIERFTLNEWTVIALAPFWISVLTFALIQFRPGLRGSLRGLAWTFAAIALVGFAGMGIAWKHASQPVAVVIATESTVRNGPLEEAPQAFSARNGAELQVIDEKDAWLQVSAGNRIGWLKRDDVILWRGI